MTNYFFVFAHGWGSNKDFWQNLQPLIANDDNFYLCDFDYFNNREETDNFSEIIKKKKSNPDNKIVGVGHSLGFLKLLEMDFYFDYYFGLQSFISFCGKNAIARKNFEKYKKKFYENPVETIKNNYSGMNHYFNNLTFDLKNLNLQNLSNDLELLGREFDGLNYFFNKLNHCKYHIIASNRDLVVPLLVVNDSFSQEKITILNDDSHWLGLLKAEEVRDLIFKTLDLEKLL